MKQNLNENFQPESLNILTKKKTNIKKQLLVCGKYINLSNSNKPNYSF